MVAIEDERAIVYVLARCLYMNIQEKQDEVKRLNRIACVWKIIAVISFICCVGACIIGFKFKLLVGVIIFIFGLITGIVSIAVCDSYVADISAIDFELLTEQLKEEGIL